MESKKLIISNSTEYHSIDTDRILYVQSDGNYCTFHLTGGVTLGMLPISLKETAGRLRDITNMSGYHRFIQIGRSHIVSLNHIESIYTSRRLIVFDETDHCSMSRVSLSVSNILIYRLRNILENSKYTTLVTDDSSILKEQDYDKDNGEVIIL